MSVSFYAAKFFPATDRAGGYHGPVFDFAEGTTLDLSNGNAALVAQTLGYAIEDGALSAPIDAFIATAQAWLADNPEASPAVPTVVSQQPFGPKFVHCGLPEGYLQARIAGLLELATAGRAAGATRMVGA